MITNARDFLFSFSCMILTLVSNYRNVCNASPSLDKDSCMHTMKSILQTAKHPNDVVPRVGFHRIDFSHRKYALE